MVNIVNTVFYISFYDLTELVVANNRNRMTRSVKLLRECAVPTNLLQGCLRFFGEIK